MRLQEDLNSILHARSFVKMVQVSHQAPELKTTVDKQLTNRKLDAPKELDLTWPRNLSNDKLEKEVSHTI